MISFGSLADIILMIFRSDLTEHCRSVVDLAINQLLETMSRWDEYFRRFF